MPKRKRPCDESPPVHTCPTLSEFMNQLVADTLRTHRPCVLNGKSRTHRAMITTRTKLRSSYDDSIKQLASMHSPEPEQVHCAEFQHIALTLALAITNGLTAKFDIDRLAEKVKNSRVRDGDPDHLFNDHLNKFFMPTALGVIDLPSTVVDEHGRVILWYLPDIVAPFRIAAFNESVKHLRHPLQSSMQDMSGTGIPYAWRLTNYSTPPGGAEFGSGTLNFSPGWFQRGHERLVDNLHVSQDMQKKGALSFITETHPFEVLVDAVTSVINPQLYSAGLQAIQALPNGCHGTTWASVWSGMALIVNRETPYHRDRGASISMYDLLVSAGTHQACYIEVAELGAEFLYLPATMLALSGKVLMHRVKSWAGGERICAAHFMKDGVHNRLGQPRPAWPLLDDYL